jgi:tetratricopeptide (TPR) repeat protein
MNYILVFMVGIIMALLLGMGCSGSRLGGPKSAAAPGGGNTQRADEAVSQGQHNLMQSEGIALIKKLEFDRALLVYQKIAGLSYYRGQGEKMSAFAIMLEDIGDFGDIKKCVSWCQQFIRENPGEDSIAVAKNLSVIYGKANMFTEARDALKPYAGDPRADQEFYRDYSKYCLDVVENVKMEAPERQAALADAKAAVDTIREKWGEGPGYYAALADYNLVSKNFQAASEAYDRCLALASKDRNSIDLIPTLSYAGFVKMNMSILAGEDSGKALEYFQKSIDSLKGLDARSYDRFFADRPMAMLVSEYYLGQESIQSWQIKKMIEEHEAMAREGYAQPEQLKKLYAEIYNFLASREKNDMPASLTALRRISAYLSITQECPAYNSVHIAAGQSMLKGYMARIYEEMGDYGKAANAYKESLKYFPGNKVSRRGLEKVSPTKGV